jgi:hypothetical protein
LPKITAQFPEVLYLIIGKTHPEVKNDGEVYRVFYKESQGVEIKNVIIHKYLSLEVL